MSCLAAACLQIGAGISAANGQDAGIWYMDGPQYPHELRLDSVAASAGMEGQSWRAGVEYLGKFQADALAIASNDPRKIACAPRCYPTSTFNGSGKVYGAYIEYVAHFGSLRAEVGPWLYRATWEERVPDYANVGNCLGHGTAWEVTNCNVSADKTTIGAVGGLGYDIGPYTAALSAWMASDRGCDRSIVKNFVINFEVRYAFD